MWSTAYSFDAYSFELVDRFSQGEAYFIEGSLNIFF